MTRFATLLAIPFLLVAAAGCTSAEGAFNAGVDAEAEGDLDRAFERYHTALRRDAEYPGAREGLASVGAEIVRVSLAEAARATPTRAADLHLRAETTRDRAAEVGVTLRLPAAFAAERDAALARAVEHLRGLAADAGASGAYADALEHLSAARGYRPSPEAARALDLNARDAYTLWAEADLGAGRYRRALDGAERALGLSAPDSPEAARLAALQSAILDAGSIRVAFFPAERMEGGGSDGRRGSVGGATPMPRDFLYDLDDVLADDHWRVPPPFVLTADPADARRLIRRERDADDLIARDRLLASLAGDLDADLGGAFATGLWRETREERSRDARRADLRRGGSATYDRVRTRLSLGATVDYRVIDARTRAVVCEGDVERDVRETVTTHEYDGDWRDLDLGRDDRRRFTDAHSEDAEAELYAGLAEALAAGVSAEVYRCVGRLVP